MLVSPRNLGGFIRRGLAVCAVLGQLLGTIGIVPAQAKSSDSSSAPYPCQKHPCGCRTAEQCWSGPCCCFTMREKVAWAAEHEIVAPQHAVQMAEEEAASEAWDDVKSCQSLDDCCAKNKAKNGSGKRGKPSDIRNGTGWVPMLFAQQCHGPGFNEQGFLNIGIPPIPSTQWICEYALVERFHLPNQIPIFTAMKPVVPPPNC
jgi:hypothetical protein